MLRLAAVALALLIGAAQASAAESITPRYDTLIQRSSARWLPWHWTHLKAQLYAESRLDPSAVSSAGARGLAQLMPRTSGEIARALHAGMASAHDVEYSIEAAAYYMARMRATWLRDRDELERRRLAQASYNAGPGNIIAAQRACLAAATGPCLTWGQVQPHLVKVTGRANAWQTADYVERIERVQARLVGG